MIHEDVLAPHDSHVTDLVEDRVNVIAAEVIVEQQPLGVDDLIIHAAELFLRSLGVGEVEGLAYVGAHQVNGRVSIGFFQHEHAYAHPVLDCRLVVENLQCEGVEELGLA